MSKVLTGPKACLKINGVKIAYIGGLEINEEDTLTDIDILDQLETAELAETGHKVDFSCSVFKVVGQTTADLGIAPANLSDILTQPELVAEVYNSVENVVAYTITGVKWAGGSGTLDARGVWQGRWNFGGRIGRGM